MAKLCEFLNSDNFSAVPVPSPLNRAVNKVSRPNGHARRAFVRIAPYILDLIIQHVTLVLLYMDLLFVHCTLG